MGAVGALSVVVCSLQVQWWVKEAYRQWGSKGFKHVTLAEISMDYAFARSGSRCTGSIQDVIPGCCNE